ncbi:ribonuclease H-like domain-containing protein [Mrakia frigida]|uniref:ribonuclease H-like domain-containing protein n=1 Tax=Mrakia frigida TaxID=29902 RepID=UPI003FCC2688
MAHVLHLVVVKILSPFRSRKTKSKGKAVALQNSSDSERSSNDDEPSRLNDHLDFVSDEEVEDADANEEFELDSDEEAQLERELEQDLPDETEEERRERLSKERAFREVLTKATWLSKQLRFSAQTRSKFKKLCARLLLSLPHSLRRPIDTRWNSMLCMIEDAIRLFPALLVLEEELNVRSSKKLKSSDLKLLRMLSQALMPFRTTTLLFERKQVPMIHEALIYIDLLRDGLVELAGQYSPGHPMRGIARRGIFVLDKYWKISDETPLHRLAVLLHPSFKRDYFAATGWKPAWIKEALDALYEMWNDYYYVETPPGTSPAPLLAPTSSGTIHTSSFFSKPKSYVARKPNPIEAYLNAPRVLSPEGQPIDGFQHWSRAKLAGEEHDGLTNLALDVLSCPATSVDVERAFRSSGLQVSALRHNLGSARLGQLAALGLWSKADLVPDGLLKDRKVRE